MDDAWPEHLEGLQIPGNFHKSRDVVPYSAWSRGVWIAAWHAVQNKAASTLSHVHFSTCCKHIYKQSLDFYQKIGQNSNEHLKLLRCPSEKRKTDQQPAAWSFAGKSDVSSAASTLSPWFCMILPCLTKAWPTDSDKVCKGAMLCLGLQDPLN